MRMRRSRARAAMQRRHDGFAEMIERNSVAEEKRLVGRHRLDDIDDERFGIGALELLHQRGEVVETGLAHDRQQPAFDQIMLVRSKHETGTRFQEIAQIVVVERGHGRPPWNRRTVAGAIWSSGKHRRAQTGLEHRAGHAPDHARGLVLRDHVAARGHDLPPRHGCRRCPCRSSPAPGSRRPRFRPPRRTADRPPACRN